MRVSPGVMCGSREQASDSATAWGGTRSGVRPISMRALAVLGPIAATLGALRGSEAAEAVALCAKLHRFAEEARGWGTRVGGCPKSRVWGLRSAKASTAFALVKRSQWKLSRLASAVSRGA